MRYESEEVGDAAAAETRQADPGLVIGLETDGSHEGFVFMAIHRPATDSVLHTELHNHRVRSCVTELHAGGGTVAREEHW